MGLSSEKESAAKAIADADVTRTRTRNKVARLRVFIETNFIKMKPAEPL
jgi:hypothetical protein